MYCLVRPIGFPVHAISASHCYTIVLMEDITEMWQDACHIWKYYIIKYYKMLVIFTYNDRHWEIFTKMTQYGYLPDCWWSATLHLGVVKSPQNAGARQNAEIGTAEMELSTTACVWCCDLASTTIIENWFWTTFLIDWESILRHT